MNRYGNSELISQYSSNSFVQIYASINGQVVQESVSLYAAMTRLQACALVVSKMNPSAITLADSDVFFIMTNSQGHLFTQMKLSMTTYQNLTNGFLLMTVGFCLIMILVSICLVFFVLVFVVRRKVNNVEGVKDGIFNLLVHFGLIFVFYCAVRHS
jgi:hypothetical protein